MSEQTDEVKGLYKLINKLKGEITELQIQNVNYEVRIEALQEIVDHQAMKIQEQSDSHLIPGERVDSKSKKGSRDESK